MLPFVISSSLQEGSQDTGLRPGSRTLSVVVSFFLERGMPCHLHEHQPQPEAVNPQTNLSGTVDEG